MNDRGGTTIMVIWDKGQKITGVSDAYSSFVDKDWETDWNAFQADLAKILKNQIK